MRRHRRLVRLARLEIEEARKTMAAQLVESLFKPHSQKIFLGGMEIHPDPPGPIFSTVPPPSPLWPLVTRLAKGYPPF
jgi:hypothetical protein